MNVRYLTGTALALLLVACQQDPSSLPMHADRQAQLADTLTLPATNYYEIRTPLGRMVVRLYDETPLHRDNFKRLVASGFYDSTTFHRVIDGFVIQGGDPNSKDADPTNDGTGGPGYTLPAEIRPGLFHKRGALAAARQGDEVNPERRSSGSQFYLVVGRTFDAATLNEIEAYLREQIPDPSFSFPDSVRRLYQTVGGAPFLDGHYTVFGELVEGFEVMAAIARLPTPRTIGQQAPPTQLDRPLQPVPMTIRPLENYSSGS
ncbi:MAG: peptidylprolyl isomerase [Rhodothermus sp.]|nr:peptidylprolyl isomerase [Rhodothermus sp.]